MQNNLSPEKYIRTKARQLAVDKCYINESWENSGLATIVVSRKHSNNNLTFGVFLVDILCLGVKDSLYHFNMSDIEFEDFLDSLSEHEDLVEIEYALAHNIIYGAIEFAGEYEFKPDKSFNLTQYILEEDTDDIELIDIPLGTDEKPTVVVSENNPQTAIIAQLKRIAGEGNYTVLYSDDDMEDEADDYFNPDELLKDFSDYSMDELIGAAEEAQSEASEDIFGLVFELYYRMNDEETFDKFFAPITEIQDGLQIETDYSAEGLDIVPKNQYDHFLYLQDLVYNTDEKAMDECIKTIAATPYPVYYSLLVTAYHQMNQLDKADEVIVKAFGLYPDDLSTRINYGFYLCGNKKFDQLDLFMSGYDITKMAPKRKAFHLTEIAGIYHLACLHYSQTGQLLKASAYQQAYDWLEDISDEIFEKKYSLFELLCQLQLEEIQKKLEEK
jgi:hypothetical protein